MNLRSTVMSDESSRKLLGAFVSVFIFVVAAYEFSELVLAGDLMGFAYVGLVAVGMLLPMTFTSMVAYEDFVINAYFWTLLGILFCLPSLTLSSQFANPSAPAGNPRLRPR